MLKKTFCLATMACLSMMGTAYAGDEGAGAANVSPTPDASPAPAGDVVLDKGQLPVGGSIPDGFRFADDATFYRLSATVEHLEVPLSIDACDGFCCQKGFRFHLLCSVGGGQFDLVSPWYRNWATTGTTLRTYEWYDPQLDQCPEIDSITIESKCGWEGTLTCVGEPDDPCQAATP